MTATERPAELLVTNDDGLAGPGLRVLVEALARLGKVRVAVPREEMSGIGHAVTLHRVLRSAPVEIPPAVAAMYVEGTPADAVKLALTTVFREVPFDLVVSGINRGPNVGVNVHYSGTVGAGLEAVIAGKPAVAVSLDVGPEYDFAPAARIAARLVGQLLARLRRAERPPLPLCLINVNVPNRPERELRGLRLTRQGLSGFAEFYRPAQQAGDWEIDGAMQLREESPEYDAIALAQGYVSVTPLGLDLTARPADPGPDGWSFLLA